MNIFEKASKLKLRFQSTRGELSVENLWDLPLTSARAVSLNSIARDIYLEIQKEDNLDFVGETQSKSNSTLNLQMDIVKHIIEIKKQERALAAKQAETRSEVEFLENLLEEKNKQELQGMSKEEILERLNKVKNT